MTNKPPAPDDGHCPLVTRRRFLAGLGASAAAVTVGGYAISIFTNRGGPLLTSTTTTTAPSPPPGLPPDRTLVVIEMGGGNDGLSMVVPYADGRYHDLRGELAVTDPIDLDGEVGLHPNLRYLAERYSAGDVAIVEGIGYPDPDLSHFASMATWWAGSDAGLSDAGWLGRYLDLTGAAANPLAGIVIGPGPSPALLGTESFAVTIQDASGLRPQAPPWADTSDELIGMWEGFAPSAIDSPGLLGDVQRAIGGTLTAAAQLNETLPPSSADVPAGDLSEYLRLAAALLGSDVAPPVVYIHGFGDFDTHQAQAPRHQALMTELNDGLAAFFADLEAAGVSDRVLVMTASEFGRRAASNGSGTDHGTAAPQLLIGSSLTGGRYGESPSLTKLDRGGNLIHTVDFRSLYATVLDSWLGVEHADVLGRTYEVLPL